MENDSLYDRTEPIDPKDSREFANDILAQLGTDGNRLSVKLVTPWWYHPALGLAIAACVVMLARGLGPFVSLVVIAEVGLLLVYERRYGVSVRRPLGRASLTLLLAMTIVVITAMASGLAIFISGTNAWWSLIPAGCGFFATILLGRRYDDALRREIAARGRNAR